MQKYLSFRLVVSFIAFLALTIGFVAIANAVKAGSTLGFDQAILRAINAESTPFLNQFFLSVTEVGSIVGITVISVVTFTMLLVKRHYRRAIILGAGVAGAGLINASLKLVFERPRPDLWEQLVRETTFSFPSGHAMASAALAICIIVIFWQSRYRIIATVVASLFMVLVSFSRLYLGVHYPTDVFAGWLVSAAWIMVVVTVVDGWLSYHSLKKK